MLHTKLFSDLAKILDIFSRFFRIKVIFISLPLFSSRQDRKTFNLF